MRKPARGPKYRERQGAVTLREMKRPDLVKDPYRVRGQYIKEDGHLGTFDATSWRDARERAQTINKQLEERNVAPEGAVRFDRVWKEWYRTREEDCALGYLSTATLRHDRDNGRYLLQELGRRRIDTILSVDVERWLKRFASTYPAMAQLCKIQLGQVLHYAVRKRYIPFNPLRQDPIKLPRPEGERPWVPGWDAMDRVVERGRGPRFPDYARHAWSNMATGTALGGGAGLRISEVVAILWEDIDFPNRVLHVRRALTSDGVTLPKKRYVRDVPMCQWVYEALLNHAHVLSSLGKKLEGPVIWNRINPGQPCNRSNWNNSFKRFLVHAGVLEAADQETEWHWHVLRRFFISARFALGHPQLHILEAVGHRGSEVTYKHYARALPEPPSIWKHRFQPADPTARMIDGAATVLNDADHLLPATPELGGDGSTKKIPDWVSEAVRLLQGGWKLNDVCTHLRHSRYSIGGAFKRYGLPPPVQIYREARDRRYEQLYNDQIGPVDIVQQTGTSESAYQRWRVAYEAGIPTQDRKALTMAKQSRRKNRSVKTDGQQRQLSLL